MIEQEFQETLVECIQSIAIKLYNLNRPIGPDDAPVEFTYIEGDTIYFVPDKMYEDIMGGTKEVSIGTYVFEQLKIGFHSAQKLLEKELENMLINGIDLSNYIKAVSFRKRLLTQELLCYKEESYFDDMQNAFNSLWEENFTKTLEFAGSLSNVKGNDKIEWSGDREEFYAIFCNLIAQEKFKTNGNSKARHLTKAFASHFKIKSSSEKVDYLAESSIASEMGKYIADNGLLKYKK